MVYSLHWYTGIPILLSTATCIVITITYTNIIINATYMSEPMKRKCQSVKNVKG